MTVKGVRLALVAVLALTALLLSLAAMHSAMVSSAGPGPHEHTAAMSMVPVQADSPVDAAVSPGAPWGGMSPTDCLLFSMVCFLMAVAVLLAAVVCAGLRSLRRPRVTQLLLAARGRLWPPSPPSLLVLSISRV